MIQSQSASDCLAATLVRSNISCPDLLVFILQNPIGESVRCPDVFLELSSFSSRDTHVGMMIGYLISPCRRAVFTAADFEWTCSLS